MAEIVIVAIPEDRDRVWDVSSEKIPHMTLLYLGEQEIDESIIGVVEYLEHVVSTSLRKFGLSVDRRGPLGSEDADVVFLDKDGPMCKEIKGLRSNLLKNDKIFEMYNSVEQYPEWTPHVTLGYPETPAKKPEPPQDDNLWYIEFDRIAIWIEDFDGPTFRMPGWENKSAAADEYGYWSEESVDFLEHYGVKGMKWGVSRTRQQIDSGVTKVKKAYVARETQKKEDRSRPTSEDAQKKAEALRIARNASIDKLSNKELQTLVARMDLEQRYRQMTDRQTLGKYNSDNKSIETRARSFVQDALKIKMRDVNSSDWTTPVGQAFEKNKPDDWRSAF